MELFHIDLRAAVLHRQDGRRLARAPGVEKHNLAVQVMEQLGPPLEPPHTDAIVLPEAKLADAPVRRDVLVLLADGLAAKLNLDLAGFPGQLFRGNLDLAGFPGQLFRGHQLALVAVQSMQQADHHAAGGPQAGPFGRHVGQHSDLDGRLNARAHQRLANQLMLQVANLVDDLFLGIADVNQVVETRRHDYIDIFIDRRTDHQAFVLSIVTREIGRASREANAQWCLRNDHLRRCLDTQPRTQDSLVQWRAGKTAGGNSPPGSTSVQLCHTSVSAGLKGTSLAGQQGGQVAEAFRKYAAIAQFFRVGDWRALAAPGFAVIERGARGKKKRGLSDREPSKHHTRNRLRCAWCCESTELRARQRRAGSFNVDGYGVRRRGDIAVVYRQGTLIHRSGQDQVDHAAGRKVVRELHVDLILPRKLALRSGELHRQALPVDRRGDGGWRSHVAQASAEKR